MTIYCANFSHGRLKFRIYSWTPQQLFSLFTLYRLAFRGTMQSYPVWYGQQWPAAAQVVHTHRTSCRSGWSKRSGPLNSSPLSWIFTPVSVGSSPRSYLLDWFSKGKRHLTTGKRAEGLNSTSGAQFAALPLVKPVVWFARAVFNWRSCSVTKSAYLLPWWAEWVFTLHRSMAQNLSCDAPLSQKSGLYNRSCMCRKALSGVIFLAVPKLSRRHSVNHESSWARPTGPLDSVFTLYQLRYTVYTFPHKTY